MISRRLLVAALLGLAPAVVGAQSERRDFLAAGVRAYQQLDLDAAVGLLENALAESGATALSVSERGSALSYLGAANLLGGHRARATSAFRQLVELDPRLRPDSLVFPPGVLAFYDETRRATPVLAVDVHGSEIRGRGGSPLMVHLLVTTPQTIDVTLRRSGGALFASLYDGPVSDSFDVVWNGRDTTGLLPDSGRLWLRVVGSSAAPQPFSRVVRVPLDVRVVSPDTVAWPVLPAESLLPERVPGRTELRPLVGAGLLGIAAIELPRLIAGAVDATSARYAVVGALGVTGAVGVELGRRPRTFPANLRANAIRVDAWQRAVADVSAENRRRRGDAAVIVKAGTAEPRAVP